jgi:hypothetical protein
LSTATARRSLPSAQAGTSLPPPTPPSTGGGLLRSPPPPAGVPLATATADLRRAAVANFDRIAGSVGISGAGVLLGGYTTLDASSRVVLTLQAALAGTYRVRVSVSNIPMPTGLLFESAAGNSSCALRALPGYNNLQTCEVALQAGGPGPLTLAVRQQGNAAAQVTLAAVDVSHEPAAGAAADATARISLAGIAAATFDRLPGAMLTVAAQPVSIGSHVEVDNRTQIDAYLLNAPAGTYRFRALLTNTSGATTFSLQGLGREWSCSVPAQPGYQGTQACDLVLPVAAAGTVPVRMKFAAGAGAPVASLEQVMVFKEP